jgi:hypothetical protein
MAVSKSPLRNGIYASKIIEWIIFCRLKAPIWKRQDASPKIQSTPAAT